jgi:hypothetical protein
MFNALNGLGGAGQLGKDASASDASNSALYATFAVVGFFAGTVVNALGIRASLGFGGIGYCRGFLRWERHLLTHYFRCIRQLIPMLQPYSKPRLRRILRSVAWMLCRYSVGRARRDHDGNSIRSLPLGNTY